MSCCSKLVERLRQKWDAHVFTEALQWFGTRLLSQAHITHTYVEIEPFRKLLNICTSQPCSTYLRHVRLFPSADVLREKNALHHVNKQGAVGEGNFPSNLPKNKHSIRIVREKQSAKTGNSPLSLPSLPPPSPASFAPHLVMTSLALCNNVLYKVNVHLSQALPFIVPNTVFTPRSEFTAFHHREWKVCVTTTTASSNLRH